VTIAEQQILDMIVTAVYLILASQKSAGLKFGSLTGTARFCHLEFYA
jgi:hypothetical protein